MRHRKLLFSFSLLLSVNLYAQVNFVDTIKRALLQKPTADFRLDGRNSFLTGTRTPITGIKLGLNFDNTFMIGCGWLWINDLRKNTTKKLSIFENNILLTTTRLHYFVIYTNYVFYKTNHWQFSVAPQIGIGTTYYTYSLKDIPPSERQSKHSLVFIYEPMMSGNYRITKYFGVGANLGWRFTAKNNSVVKDFLTSPIYAFHLDVYWWTIYKQLIIHHKPN